jgi:Ran GTPase-activating protein (RanGAP) involved in mRNA processing and transport
LTAIGLSELVAALALGCSPVERLYLCGNRLGPTEAKTLTGLLRNAPSLHHLYLSVNRLGDEGTALLAGEGLRENQSLRTLSLSSNGIGPEGAAALAEAVQHHPALRVLELGRQASAKVLGEQPNAIGDRGAAELAAALPGHPSLAVLDLLHNGITDEGAAVLTEGLAGNHSLVELRLGREVSRHRRRQIEELLTRNRKLANAVEQPPNDDLSVIRSVYRTAPKQASVEA